MFLIITFWIAFFHDRRVKKRRAYLTQFRRAFIGHYSHNGYDHAMLVNLVDRMYYVSGWWG